MAQINNSDIVRRYKEDGYVVLPEVIDKNLTLEAQGHIEWLGRKYPDLRPEQYHHQLIVDDPFWIRLCTEPSLVDVVESFLGSDIALFAAHYISKPPRDGQPVLWHQDSNYCPLEPMEVITIWLAIDDSTKEICCMRVIPGSHVGQQLFKHRSSHGENVLQSELELIVDESKAVNVKVPSGGVSLHDPYLIHGSKANLSDTRRCGLTLRYIPTSTRIKREKFPTYLCRGKVIENNNYYPPIPRFRPGEHYPFEGCDQPPWK